MLFSICLCTYNRYDYIRYTIDSILDQLVEKEKDFEFVICDSGSTDGTLEYLDSLENVRVLNIGFIGLARSYIYAFSKANGKYIVNINDHTYIRLQNITKCLQELEYAPEIHCVMNNLSAYGYGVKNRKPFETPEFNKIPGMPLHHLFIFRKEYVDYFDKKFVRNMWDYDFMVRVLTNGGSIAFYKYVFGCEIKIKENVGILSEQRHDHKSNVLDDNYFKLKNKTFLHKINKFNGENSFSLLSKFLLRMVIFFINKFKIDKFFLLLQKKETIYTVNRLHNCDSQAVKILELDLHNFEKSSSYIIYMILLKLLYHAADNNFIEKFKWKNFYLIQKLK